MFSFATLLFFAVTGISLNHNNWSESRCIDDPFFTHRISNDLLSEQKRFSGLVITIVGALLIVMLYYLFAR